jgi:hypothetical protein
MKGYAPINTERLVITWLFVQEPLIYVTFNIITQRRVHFMHH